MNMSDRIAALKVKQDEIRKMEMALKMKTAEADAEFKDVVRGLGVPESFGMVDLIDRALNYYTPTKTLDA